MRRLLVALIILAALVGAGCSGSGSSPIAPSLPPAVASGTAPAAGQSVNIMVPDLARCLAGADAGCFTARPENASTAPLIEDVGRCFQSASQPGCLSEAHSSSSVVRVHASAASPGGLTYTAVGGTVTLTWIAPAGVAIVSYIIEAGSAPGLTNLASFTTGTTATTFSASGVGAGTYFVRVRGVSAAGPTDPSNEAVVVVGGPCNAPPGAPALTVVSNQGGTVVIAWTPGAGAASSYIVEAGSAAGLANLLNADQGPTTTLTATGVPVGTYYVRVRGRNNCGVGGPSNEVVVAVGAADVEYRVTGSPGEVFITYTNASGTTTQLLASIPWSTSLSGVRPGSFLFLSAQHQVVGTVVVSIFRNGIIYKTSTAEGPSALALVSGTY